MTIDAIAEASVGLKEEYIPMVVSYIDFLKGYKKINPISDNPSSPKDAMNVFAGSLYYMADDFNETPDEFKEYM